MRSSKIPIAVLALASLALVSAWAFIVFKSYSYKADIAEASLVAKERSAEGSYLSSLRSLMREEKEGIEAIEARFVREEDIPGFVASLEERARGAGVEASLGSLGLGAADEGSLIAPLSISIVGKGSWQSLMRFISSLESLPYTSKIENISLTTTETSPPEATSAIWNGRIDFIQYVEKSAKKNP